MNPYYRNDRKVIKFPKVENKTTKVSLKVEVRSLDDYVAADIWKEKASGTRTQQVVVD